MLHFASCVALNKLRRLITHKHIKVCSYELSWVGLPRVDSDLCWLCLPALPFGTFVQAGELEGHVLTFKCFGPEVRHELVTWPQLAAWWLENVQEHMGIQ